MPRARRIWFPGATYHIIQRGVNQQNIFGEVDDYVYFLKTLAEIKKEMLFKVYLYVLLANHYHLTVEASKNHISEIMHAINSSYAIRFNKKYQRTGHLFQGRFKGILIDKENYLLELSRYIHLNPVKAGLVNRPEDYIWSSYRYYIGKEKNFLIDIELILNNFKSASRNGHKSYENFVTEKMDQINEERDWLSSNTRRQRFLGKRNFIKKLLELEKSA